MPDALEATPASSRRRDGRIARRSDFFSWSLSKPVPPASLYSLSLASNSAMPVWMDSKSLIGRVCSMRTSPRSCSSCSGRPLSMSRTMRRQPSKPLHISACLNIVSAVPVRHWDRNPQSAALSSCCFVSSIAGSTTRWKASSVTVILSCRSAHRRISRRAGTLEMKYRSTRDFQAGPPRTPSNLYSGWAVNLSS